MAARLTVFLLSVIEVAIAFDADLVNTTKEQWEADRQAVRDQLSLERARAKKMAAVDKAIEMLEKLQTQVMMEGESEAATYNKFACFCKDTTDQRLQSIQSGEDQSSELSTTISSLSTRRNDLDTKMQTLNSDVATLETEMKQAEEHRQSAAKLHGTNIVDLNCALEALLGAIQTLKASRKPGLQQLKSVSDTVRTASLLADALGLASPGIAMFTQTPSNDVQLEDYKYHSDSIIETLEKLLKDFQSKKNDIDAAEVESVRVHKQLMQEKLHAKDTKLRELAKARQDKSEIVEEIATTGQQLSTVQATLLEDKEYTNKLSQLCGDKARTWDQRSLARANELATLTQAVGIMHGEVKGNTSEATIRFVQQGVSVRIAKVTALDAGAMGAIEMAAETADKSPAFVQVRAHRGMLRATANRRYPPGKARDVVMELLKSEGRQLRSTLLTALASKLAADPFAKVKQLIQELIERLQKEEANEATQKGWCDKATVEAEQKRDFAAEDIASLNSVLAKLSADIDHLNLEVSEMGQQVTNLVVARTNATNERRDEKAENAAAVEQATEGITALQGCIDLLDKFYKTLSKDSVDSSSMAFLQGPLEDAPGSGFGRGEAYIGAQSEAGGIIALLEVMKSDFLRTVTETEKAEAQAKQDHLEFLTASGKALAQATEAKNQLEDQRNDALSKHEETNNKFLDTTQTLHTALRELMDLKPVCISTGMGYSDRVSHRDQEIAALNQALCILGKYQEFGYDGAGGCGVLEPAQ